MKKIFLIVLVLHIFRVSIAGNSISLVLGDRIDVSETKFLSQSKNGDYVFSTSRNSKIIKTDKDFKLLETAKIKIKNKENKKVWPLDIFELNNKFYFLGFKYFKKSDGNRYINLYCESFDINNMELGNDLILLGEMPTSTFMTYGYKLSPDKSKILFYSKKDMTYYRESYDAKDAIVGMGYMQMGNTFIDQVYFKVFDQSLNSLSDVIKSPYTNKDENGSILRDIAVNNDGNVNILTFSPNKNSKDEYNFIWNNRAYVAGENNPENDIVDEDKEFNNIMDLRYAFKDDNLLVVGPYSSICNRKNYMRKVYTESGLRKKDLSFSVEGILFGECTTEGKIKDYVNIDLSNELSSKYNLPLKDKNSKEEINNLLLDEVIIDDEGINLLTHVQSITRIYYLSSAGALPNVEDEVSNKNIFNIKLSKDKYEIESLKEIPMNVVVTKSGYDMTSYEKKCYSYYTTKDKEYYLINDNIANENLAINHKCTEEIKEISVPNKPSSMLSLSSSKEYLAILSCDKNNNDFERINLGDDLFQSDCEFKNEDNMHCLPVFLFSSVNVTKHLWLGKITLN